MQTQPARQALPDWGMDCHTYVLSSVSRQMSDRHHRSTILDLSGQKPLAAGRKQSVYDHPEIAGLLVKILTDGPERRRLFPRYSEYRYGSYRPWHREASEYLSILNRGSAEIERLSRFYGFVPTTSGPGLVVEKLTGPDGRLAPTLREQVRATPKGSQQRDLLRAEVEDLLGDLSRARIIVGDLHAGNIVRAAERDNRLVIVDGLGERTLLPLTQISNTAYRAAHERRRRNLMRTIERAKHHIVDSSAGLVPA